MLEVKKQIKKAPLGVKLITIFLFLSILYALIYPWILPLLEKEAFAFFQLFFHDAGNLSLIMFFIALPFAILFFFIFREFAKGKNWVRILVIVLSILGFVSGIGNIVYPLIYPMVSFSIKGILMFIIDGLIAGYLLFNKRAINYFKK